MAVEKARGNFGLEQGVRGEFKRAIADMIFQFVSVNAPDAGAAMKAIDEQSATVITADDDEVAIQVEGEVSGASGNGEQAASYDGVTLMLKRGGDGLFEFSISRKDGKDEVNPFSYTGLSAEPASKGFRLVGEEPRLRIIPAEDGVAQIEAYTAPFLENVPAGLRAFAPKVVGLVSLSVVE